MTGILQIVTFRPIYQWGRLDPDNYKLTVQYKRFTLVIYSVIMEYITSVLKIRTLAVFC